MPPRANVKLVGTLADDLLRDFLTRVDQPYERFDEETGRDLLAKRGVAAADLPVVVLDDATVLVAERDAPGGRYAARFENHFGIDPLGRRRCSGPSS